ncbi:hypothetical protein FSP39_020066 [Pinctada imbricata]|uniref:Uncharacterized protein n=1 Tax=Pinctada imbricata TaxID=66713 RepID=A0AA89CBA9_PINIB|nr:hypothetical protein FSP39_020066 [Pinctada imbricata]
MEFRFLYRFLNFDEDPDDGLKAKDPTATARLVDHVAYGSRGQRSQYISTCSDYSYVRNLARISYNSTIRIVKIDTEKLRATSSARIIDLTTDEARKKHFEETDFMSNAYSRANGFASRFSEVVIEGFVPSSCVQLIFNGSKDELPSSEPGI